MKLPYNVVPGLVIFIVPSNSLSLIWPYTRHSFHLAVPSWLYSSNTPSKVSPLLQIILPLPFRRSCSHWPWQMVPSAQVYFPRPCFSHSWNCPQQRSPEEYLMLPLPSIIPFLTSPTYENVCVIISAYPSRLFYVNLPLQMSPFLKTNYPCPSNSSFANHPLQILYGKLPPKVKVPLPLRAPSFISPQQVLPSPYSTLHLPLACPSANRPVIVNSLKVSTSLPLPLNFPSLNWPSQQDLFLNLQLPVPLGWSFLSYPSQKSPFLKTIYPFGIDYITI